MGRKRSKHKLQKKQRPAKQAKPKNQKKSGKKKKGQPARGHRVYLVVKKQDELFLKLCDFRGGANYHRIFKGADVLPVQEGDVVLAEQEYADGSEFLKPTLKVSHAQDPKVFQTIEVFSKGLSDSFTKASLEQAESVAKVPSLGDREDLRDVDLFTIDGADTKDRDDAVFVEKLEDGSYHIIVAIADVAHYVKEGSILDREAQERGTSVYLPGKTLHMLPEVLSQGVCSVDPNVERACKAVHMWMDKDGRITGTKFTNALMKSRAALTHGQAQDAIDGTLDDITKDLITPLKGCEEVYEILRQQRKERGSIMIESDEYDIAFDEQGYAQSIELHGHCKINDIIEELMVLTNLVVGTTLKSHGGSPLLRVHSQSDDQFENFEDLGREVRRFKLKGPEDGLITADYLNYLVEKSNEIPGASHLRSLAMRTTNKAEYSIEESFHFGLGLEGYAHFTSPIRRYPDLMVHRMLEKFIAGESVARNTEALQKVVEKCNTARDMADQAERGANTRLTAELLRGKLGQTFAATVHQQSEKGTKLLLQGTNAKVFVYGPSKLQLGQEVVVQVTEANGFTGSIRGKVANDNTPQNIGLSHTNSGPKL